MRRVWSLCAPLHRWFLFFVGGALCAGCVVRAQPQPTYYPNDPNAQNYAQQPPPAYGTVPPPPTQPPVGGMDPTVYPSSPPPPPVAEYRPPQPDYNYLWVDGYWDWNGYDWAWSNGYWSPNRPGYAFIGPRYIYEGGRPVYYRGYWQGSNGYRDYHYSVVAQPGWRGTPTAPPSGGWRGTPPQNTYAPSGTWRAAAARARERRRAGAAARLRPRRRRRAGVAPQLRPHVPTMTRPPAGPASNPRPRTVGGARRPRAHLSTPCQLAAPPDMPLLALRRTRCPAETRRSLATRRHRAATRCRRRAGGMRHRRLARRRSRSPRRTVGGGSLRRPRPLPRPHNRRRAAGTPRPRRPAATATWPVRWATPTRAAATWPVRRAAAPTPAAWPASP